MKLLLQIIATLAILFVCAAVADNSWTYFNHGGLKGGLLSNLWIVFLHLVGLAVVIIALQKLWSIK